MENCTFLRRTLPGFLPRSPAGKPLDFHMRHQPVRPASNGDGKNKSELGGNLSQGERDNARAGTGDRP
jgi:hypothetical protein